ncbi:MAG: hypothetical protein GY868_13315 [Deltaproteobacteria bacterium]|nr:hypothetical protein [Deltaproteobacteria bacterium]
MRKKLNNKTRGVITGGLLLILFMAAPVRAHKVNIFAYVEDGRLYAQGYFADGGACRNCRVDVHAADGDIIVSGITNMDGEVSFKLDATERLTLVLDAGMGHRGKYMLADEDIGDVTAANDRSAAVQFTDRSIAPARLESLVDDALDKKLRPLMQRLGRLENSGPGITEILGGIGYIIGLMGLVAYMKAKNKNSQG